MAIKDLSKMSGYNAFSNTTYYPIKNKILNGLLGGKGLPRGSVLHIAAGSGTGKSTIVLSNICLDLLKQGVDVAYIDADRGINDDLLKTTGVAPYLIRGDEFNKIKDINLRSRPDVESEAIFTVFKACTFKECNEVIQSAVDTGFKMIVVDTISIMDSGLYLGKDAYDIENQKIGGNTKPIKQLLMNMNHLAEKDERRINFIILNHTSKEIGGMTFGPPKETPKGGEAVISYPDIVMQLYKYSSKSETLNGKPIGLKIYANLIKSRHTTGKVKTPFFLRYGRGISNLLTYKSIFEDGNTVPGCYIETKGRTYYLRHPDLKEEIKYVGKDNLIYAIRDNYSTIDKLFTSADWIIDTTKENDMLDIESILDNQSKLPSSLQKYSIDSYLGNKIYFKRGVDCLGQPYGLYYDFGINKLVKEFNSGTETLSTRDFEKASQALDKYVEGIKNI